MIKILKWKKSYYYGRPLLRDVYMKNIILIEVVMTTNQIYSKNFQKLKKLKFYQKRRRSRYGWNIFLYFFSRSVFLPHHLSFLFLCWICFSFVSFCNTKNNFLITKILFFSHFTFYLLFFFLLFTFYLLLFTFF